MIVAIVAFIASLVSLPTYLKNGERKKSFFQNQSRDKLKGCQIICPKQFLIVFFINFNYSDRKFTNYLQCQLFCCLLMLIML